MAASAEPFLGSEDEPPSNSLSAVTAADDEPADFAELAHGEDLPFDRFDPSHNLTSDLRYKDCVRFEGEHSRKARCHHFGVRRVPKSAVQRCQARSITGRRWPDNHVAHRVATNFELLFIGPFAQRCRHRAQ